MTGFQRDQLYVIAGLTDPPGLVINVEVETYYETVIHHGRLSPNLDTLVENGLIEKGQKDRRMNVYRITNRGEGEIEARRDWERKYIGVDQTVPVE